MEATDKVQRALQELRQLVLEAEEDILAGRVGLFDAEAMKREVRERLRHEGIVD